LIGYTETTKEVHVSIKENLISLSNSYNSPALREAAAYIEVLESEVKIQQERIKLLEREVAYAENGYNQKYKSIEVKDEKENQ
jgi:hypothetical protein